jgi:hypothetical protein
VDDPGRDVDCTRNTATCPTDRGQVKDNDDGRAGPTYLGVIFWRQEPSVAIQVVVGGTFDKYSYAMGGNSPDGRPVGVLTAYCTPVNQDGPERTQLCPRRTGRIPHCLLDHITEPRA